MRHPNIPPELADAAEEIGRDANLRVGYDTHFDAGNVELSWWIGKRLNRLDLQPLPGAEIQVTFLTDTYPFLPRLLCFLRSFVPFFPHLAKTEHRVLGKLERAKPRAEYLDQIRRYIADAA